MRLICIFMLAMTVAFAAHAQSSQDWRDGYTRWINGCPISPHGCNERKHPAWNLLEADNGAVTAVDVNTIRYDELNRFAYVDAYEVQGDEFHFEYVYTFMFDCHGHFSMRPKISPAGSPMIYAPPRSIAAQIGVLACAKKPDMCGTLRKQGIECQE